MISFFKKHSPKPSPAIIGLMVIIVLHSQLMYLVNLDSPDLIVGTDMTFTFLGSLSAFIAFYLGLFAFNLLSSCIKALFGSLNRAQEAK